MLVEIAREKDGVTPEVSYGTHFFQDLVEADIIPLPIYPNEEGVVFNADFFANSANQLLRFEADRQEFVEVIKVIDVAKESSGRRLSVYLDERGPHGVGVLQ